MCSSMYCNHLTNISCTPWLWKFSFLKGKNKFLKDVEQITFSADFANKTGQKVLYVTECCVFQLTKEGIELIEVAPGVDIEKDILAHMDFKPIIKDVKVMDERIFKDELMGLAK